MSIYGPPRRERASVRRQRAQARLTRIVLSSIVALALLFVGLMALFEFERAKSPWPSSSPAPRVVVPTYNADALFPLPPPAIELPPPLQTAEIIGPPVKTPTRDATPRLQTAEIIR